MVAGLTNPRIILCGTWSGQPESGNSRTSGDPSRKLGVCSGGPTWGNNQCSAGSFGMPLIGRTSGFGRLWPPGPLGWSLPKFGACQHITWFLHDVRRLGPCMTAALFLSKSKYCSIFFVESGQARFMDDSNSCRPHVNTGLDAGPIFGRTIQIHIFDEPLLKVRSLDDPVLGRVDFGASRSYRSDFGRVAFE